ncbi:hypothetical protein D3C87_796290 [compost metagenome]
MYHLVFHSRKHQPSTYYYRQPKINRSSTHNQFELDTIRSAIKTRWTLTGFGKTDFQTALWDMEDKLSITAPPGHLHTHMNGHIITVEGSADVIWFRLNHENVSKNKCVLHEIYRDLDADYVNTRYAEFMEINNRLSTRYSLNGQLTQAMYALDRFAGNSVTIETTSIGERSIEAVRNLKEVLKENQGLVDKERTDCRAIATEVFEYVKSKRTNVG